jgi:hypothetical protein
MATKAPSPFEAILGDGFAQLAEPLRRLHGLDHEVTVFGFSDVAVDPGFLPWLICKLAGLPRSGRDVPIKMRFSPDGKGREHWHRWFADRHYNSEIRAAQSPKAPLLIEHLGPFTLHFHLSPRGDTLDWILVKWCVFGLPMPGWALPKVACNESGDGNRFVFDIDAAFPIAGHVIHYRGWLA